MCKLETEWRGTTGTRYASAVDTNGCGGCFRTTELKLHTSSCTEICCHTTETGSWWGSQSVIMYVCFSIKVKWQSIFTQTLVINYVIDSCLQFEVYRRWSFRSCALSGYLKFSNPRVFYNLAFEPYLLLKIFVLWTISVVMPTLTIILLSTLPILEIIFGLLHIK
jgi:hypothetical protein